MKAVMGMLLVIPFITTAIDVVPTIGIRAELRRIERSPYQQYSIYSIDDRELSIFDKMDLDYRVYNILDELFEIEFIDIERQFRQRSFDYAFYLSYPLAVMNRRSFQKIKLYGIYGERIELIVVF